MDLARRDVTSQVEARPYKAEIIFTKSFCGALEFLALKWAFKSDALDMKTQLIGSPFNKRPSTLTQAQPGCGEI
uniref:Uncharacterized protein n=1 Tax=Romanomermis culicivorax TaxID=13658 RepID=A0A915K6L5_ROMCU